MTSELVGRLTIRTTHPNPDEAWRVAEAALGHQFLPGSFVLERTDAVSAPESDYEHALYELRMAHDEIGRLRRVVRRLSIGR